MNTYVYVKHKKKKKEIEKKMKTRRHNINFVRKFGNREIIMGNHEHF